MKILHMVAFGLVVIGGLNWLLVGVVGWDIGQQFLGGQESIVSKIIYILVGLSAIYLIVVHKADCKTCSMKGGPAVSSSPMPGGGNKPAV